MISSSSHMDKGVINAPISYLDDTIMFFSAAKTIFSFLGGTYLVFEFHQIALFLL